jgi:primosomal protein N' (replication factor Y)
MEDRVARGSRVRVPLGRRKVIGTVVEYPSPAPDSDVELREIESVARDEPRVDEPLLELTRFVADYYLCSWGEAIETALPPNPGPPPVRKLVRRTPGSDPDSVPARAVARRRVLEALPADGSPIPLGRLGRSGRRVVPALRELGLIEVIEHSAGTAPGAGAEARPSPEEGPAPTPAQAAVLERLYAALRAGEYAPFLLYGATGSGKTEVYLRTATAALSDGRGVLYLVPEIGLTPLLVQRLRRRFPGAVSVLHSALPSRKRQESWRAVQRGERRFVVGTRSAVFAPIADLGLVIVDEEQDTSYKQDETPRYNGRDLAVVRARESRAVLALGSATPSLESFHHARSGRYALLELGGRVEDRPLPSVRIVDMRREFQDTGEIRPVSRSLLAALEACVARKEQALVLRNRRGWAVAIFCPACGERVSCERCSIALTWHRSDRRLRCHHCGFETTRPEQCPACGGREPRMLGEGSERIEDDLRNALPGARIERMDRDTVRRKGAHEALLRRFERGEIDILVGTQMIAKGHDFPRVTLVGVLSADQTLGLQDFRAAERAFQLLTQAAGRAGRGDAPGEVIVQAFEPGHPVLREAAAQDFDAFYEREIRYRRALRYPPLTALVEILITDRDQLRAAEWGETLADALREETGERLLLAGPGPAPIERLRGLYRHQILVRTAGRRRLVDAVDRALTRVEGLIPRRAITVDVDPLSVL